MAMTGRNIWVTNPYTLSQTSTDDLVGTWHEFTYHRVIMPSGAKWFFYDERDYEIFQDLWWYSFEDYVYYKRQDVIDEDAE